MENETFLVKAQEGRMTLNDIIIGWVNYAINEFNQDAIVKCNELPMAVKDVLTSELTREVTVISNLARLPEGKGIGSEELARFMKFYKEDDYIIAYVQPMYTSQEDFDAAKADGSYNIGMDKLVKVYEKAGFESINDYCGMEHTVIMMFKNKAYDKLRQAITELNSK